MLIDESVLGWGEFELEVMRDHADNVVIVCSIENVDPMGVHTGDSVTVAPQMTLTDRQYQQLRDQAIAVIRAVGVETGGSNVQFAVNPATDEIVVIEMNPRVSRSSALASKATGFPIAKIAARLAVGYRLDEIPNDITRRTPASFEPAIDYVVVKWPRFAFEKFPGVDDRALDPHEVRGRGDGDRADVHAGLRARRCARASSTRRRSSTAPTTSCSTASRPRAPTATTCSSSCCAAARASTPCAPAPASTRGSCAELRRLAEHPEPDAGSGPTARSTPAPPSSRPRRPTTTPPGSARPPAPARPPTRSSAASARA